MDAIRWADSSATSAPLKVVTLADFSDSASTADARLVLLVAAALRIGRLRRVSWFSSLRHARLLLLRVFIVLRSLQVARGCCSIVGRSRLEKGILSK